MSSTLANWPALIAGLTMVLVLAENALGVTGAVLFPSLDDPAE
ncbi:hypothetical protein [Phreatobacter sp.]